MAQEKFNTAQLVIIGEALGTYKDEVKKLMKKAEKLGLEEQHSLKVKFLEVEALQGKLDKQQ